MLIKADAKALEWRVKAFLAQDKVALEEINNNFDFHEDNKVKLKLPSRTIAKNFAYRMIFADSFGDQGFQGPAYAYSHDPNFMHVSTSIKYWTGIVENFYSKYEGMYRHGINQIKKATTKGRIVSPSGRIYIYKPVVKWNNQTDWPRTNILNWPVQGLAADFMILVRRNIRQLLIKYPKILLVNTVHDDIEWDSSNHENWYAAANFFQEIEFCFKMVPEDFEQLFGVEVNIPIEGEIKFGLTLFEDDMIKYNPNTFKEDFERICNSKSM